MNFEFKLEINKSEINQYLSKCTNITDTFNIINITNSIIANEFKFI